MAIVSTQPPTKDLPDAQFNDTQDLNELIWATREAVVANGGTVVVTQVEEKQNDDNTDN